jgi:hypothetical protein
MLNIFADDAFSIVSLSDAITKIKFVPGYLESISLFSETSVNTTSVAIEEVDGVLKIISPTPRGGPGRTLDKPVRTLRSVVVPHFEVNDAVMAEEVQGVRAFGAQDQVDTVAAKVTERLQIARSSLEATLEYARVGAVKGVVTYADATTLDLFALFGVTQETEIDFALDDANPAAGVLRKACAAVIRLMAKNMGGQSFGGVAAIVGDTFFDQLLAHTEVRNTFLNNPQAAMLRTSYISAGQSFGSFEFGGILWQNYRGFDNDANPFVEATKAHFYPTGVPNLFRTYFAPADYNETVNTMGQRLYAKQYNMLNDKGVHLDSQMNALNICTRPKALLKGKNT